MMVEDLLETTCKWKEANDIKAEESKQKAKLMKCLSHAEDALKMVRAERDVSLWANEELGQIVAKKDMSTIKYGRSSRKHKLS